MTISKQHLNDCTALFESTEKAITLEDLARAIAIGRSSLEEDHLVTNGCVTPEDRLTAKLYWRLGGSIRVLKWRAAEAVAKYGWSAPQSIEAGVHYLPIIFDLESKLLVPATLEAVKGHLMNPNSICDGLSATWFEREFNLALEKAIANGGEINIRDAWREMRPSGVK